MKKLLFLLLIIVSCNQDNVDQDTPIVDKYYQEGEQVKPSGELEERYCVCEYIDIEFPVINGVTNWVHVYDGVVGQRVRFQFQIYLWQLPHGGWYEVLGLGDHNFIADYCNSDPYEDGRTVPRKIFGRADYFCDGSTYLMVSSMYPQDANGNYYYCGSLERTFEYTTDVSGTKCNPNR